MTTIAGIGFAAPWLLAALLALPILLLLLRAVPPAPIKRRFPGVGLLLGLQDAERVADRTPWWLLLLRMLAVAALIFGLAGPTLDPQSGRTEPAGPLLILVDSSWAAAPRWPLVKDTLAAKLDAAAAAQRRVALLQLTQPTPLTFHTADHWLARLDGMQPDPWQPSSDQIAEAVAAIAESDARNTLWISDGLAYPDRDKVLATAEAIGPVTVVQSENAVVGLHPPAPKDGMITLRAQRTNAGGALDTAVLAQGRDPAGTLRVLASTPLRFEEGARTAETTLALPAEMQARLVHFELQGMRSAGARALVDDRLQRREVALIAGSSDREGLELLSPLHYLEQALAPSADLIDGGLMEILPANPDVIVLADVATLSQSEADALATWVSDGGLLVRFAGPRVAASDVSRDAEDPLMPVRLRSGGRTVGGAMSWGAPKALAPFKDSSPFVGLRIPDDVRVTAQVMAQPDPQLASRVIAELSDGTPLVTRKLIDEGQVVLFHVTANAEWSSLPLSGLFVEMLERLAVSRAPATPDVAELESTTWQAERVMNGFGALRAASAMPGIAGLELVTTAPGPDMLPGLYTYQDRSLARNVLSEDSVLEPAIWPERISLEGFGAPVPDNLGAWILAAALILLVADVIATLALSGLLVRSVGTAALVAIFAALPQKSSAQESADAAAIAATAELVLAHVLTGNAAVDNIAAAGLRGLSETLFFRTSVEPASPVGVNLETDSLVFYPILYWPITPDQPRPSAEAYAKLNTYLRSGGLILFDTRDADVAGFGAASPQGRKLQQLARPLDIPTLEPLPEDHVLTRTFYLLQDFPGRHISRDIWVEAAPPDAEQVEGMPFRNLNDGVTPVVIGGNDWAGAWAISQDGSPLLPVGRGFSGERQRELSLRFGVNLVMHVLTGNYKSDQVHVPALLDRLGQ